MTWPKMTYLPSYLPTYLSTYLITHWATFDSRYVAGFFLATGSRIFSCYRCDIVCGNVRSQLRRKTILQTCDIWDTVCNSNNWEPEFLTTFVTWQLRVTVDSIRNSCDVFLKTFLSEDLFQALISDFPNIEGKFPNLQNFHLSLSIKESY